MYRAKIKKFCLLTELEKDDRSLTLGGQVETLSPNPKVYTIFYIITR